MSRGAGGGVTSYIWHSTDVRAEYPPFSALPGIWLAPFFQQMYMNGPIFLDSYVKGPIFLTSWYMHIFFAQRFFEAAYPLGITWIDCDIRLTTSKNGYKKSKGRWEMCTRRNFWYVLSKLIDQCTMETPVDFNHFTLQTKTGTNANSVDQDVCHFVPVFWLIACLQAISQTTRWKSPFQILGSERVNIS